MNMNNTTKKQPSIFLQLSIKIIIILGIVSVLGFILIREPYSPVVFAKGLAFGGIFSILKIKLMESTVKKSITKDPARAQTFVSLHYFMRYLLTGVLLVVAALEPSISLYGTIIGVLSLKVAAYLQGKMEKPVPKDGSVEFVEWEEDEEESTDF